MLLRCCGWDAAGVEQASPGPGGPAPRRRAAAAAGRGIRLGQQFRSWAAALVCLALPLTGCSGGTGADTTDLTITVTLDEGVVPQVRQLTCNPPGGSHPDPAAACSFLDAAAAAGRDPFAPVPDDAVCTQEYRGPATATVAGTWNGAQVAATFTLTNGCEIARWTVAEPLLGALPAAN